MSQPSRDAQPITVSDRGNVLLVTYYGGATDEQYEQHLAEMDRIMERNTYRVGRWVVIIDATRWMRSNANQRKLQSAWMQKHDRLMRERTAGVAFAIDNAIVRGGLTAVLWLSPLPCAHTVVKTAEQAFMWAEFQLGEPLQRDSL